MLQFFTTLNELFTFPTGETQHPLSREADLCQAMKYKMKGTNDLFLSLTIATTSSYQVNLDVRTDVIP